MTFANAADYDKIQPSDRISLLNLKDLKPGSVSCLQRLLLCGEVFVCLLLKSFEECVDVRTYMLHICVKDWGYRGAPHIQYMWLKAQKNPIRKQVFQQFHLHHLLFVFVICVHNEV